MVFATFPKAVFLWTVVPYPDALNREHCVPSFALSFVVSVVSEDLSCQQDSEMQV